MAAIITDQIRILNAQNFESGVPESFNVLVKEIKSLGLNIDLN